MGVGRAIELSAATSTAVVVVVAVHVGVSTGSAGPLTLSFEEGWATAGRSATDSSIAVNF